MSYPILEYDPTPKAVIEPSEQNKPRDFPEKCVICFFQDSIQSVVKTHNAKKLIENRWEDGPHPVYEIEHKGERLAFFHPGVGGPISAGLLEEVIAYGSRRFIAVGGCGILEAGYRVGHLVVVSAAVRDEGTSYHYLPPSREVGVQPEMVHYLDQLLTRRELPHVVGKTWTTDAPYRETRPKIEKRRQEGCLTVEMEAASMLAVAQVRQVAFGQILYAGDDLSGEWDRRGWSNRKEIRENLFWLAADAAIGGV